MRLNCFIEQELVGNGFTDVAITYYFLRNTALTSLAYSALRSSPNRNSGASRRYFYWGYSLA